jgi:alpha-glucosidase
MKIGPPPMRILRRWSSKRSEPVSKEISKNNFARHCATDPKNRKVRLMRPLPSILLLVAACVAILLQHAVAESSYDLRSPDGKIEIRIRTAGQLRYDVLLEGRLILDSSTLSLEVEHRRLGMEAQVVDAKTRSCDQIVEPVVRQKFARIRDHYNELRLTMKDGYAVVFRAYNEGAAYRFETSLPEPQVKVYGEEANFNFPANFTVYYPQEDSFFSHNERKYLPQKLSEIASAFLATLPAVVDVGEGAKVAIAESDVDDYPGLWLRGTGGNGLAATFPPYPLKESLSRDRDYKVVESADYIATTAGTRSFPWRVMGIAQTDSGLMRAAFHRRSPFACRFFLFRGFEFHLEFLWFDTLQRAS